MPSGNSPSELGQSAAEHVVSSGIFHEDGLGLPDGFKTADALVNLLLQAIDVFQHVDQTGRIVAAQPALFLGRAS
jgi:hypothetical protein